MILNSQFLFFITRLFLFLDCYFRHLRDLRGFSKSLIISNRNNLLENEELKA